jgi:cytochrome c-type biogenesis protein CcmH/NrfF
VGVAQQLRGIYRASAMRRVLLILLLLTPALTFAVTDEEAARRTRQMSDELKSPFCPGKSLLTCTSGQAYDLRSEIKEMMMEGKTNAEIVDTLSLRFGEEISNPPQPWYTFFVPFLPWVAGILLVGWVLRRWLHRDDDGAPDPTTPPTDEDLERLARLRAQVAQEE